MPTTIEEDAKLLFKEALRHGPETALIARFVAHAAAQRSLRRIGVALDVLYRLGAAAGEGIADMDLMRQHGGDLARLADAVDDAVGIRIIDRRRRLRPRRQRSGR